MLVNTENFKGQKNMFVDSTREKGTLDIVLSRNGEVIEYRTANNLVVDDGLAFIASRMSGNTLAVMSHMAIGSGTNGAGSANVTLQNELARVSLTSTTPVANVVTYVATFPAGVGTGAITEAGILNASSNGNLLCRTTFGVVNKSADDSMTITWTVSSSSAA